MIKNTLLCCCILTAAATGQGQMVRNAGPGDCNGKFAGFYAPGIVNPSEGTVELTATPSKPAAEFENEWSSAFGMFPAQPLAASTARTILGIYTPSGENNVRGIFAIARGGNAKTAYANTGREALIQGKPVNLACSWGKEGLRLYIDGRLKSRSDFPGEIGPVPAQFRVCRGAPFAISAMRISARQLPDRELSSDPSAGFTAGPDTTFIAGNDLARAEYRIIPGMDDFSVLMPVWNMEKSFTVNGSPVKLPLISSNYTNAPIKYSVKLKISDIDGNKVADREYTFELAPRSLLVPCELSPPPLSAGFYDLDMTVSAPGRAEQRWQFTHAVIPAADPQVKDGRFADYLGHHLFDHTEVLAKLNLHWCRSDAFKWNMIEPEKGRFDWALADKMVADAERNGVNCLGILGDPPVWAADPEVKPGHKNSFMAARHKPARLADWENYVSQVVSRYKGRVSHWEIWNEVDWHPPGPPASFSGTTKDYFELLKTSWQAAKKADPGCRILVSGFGYGTLCDQKMPFDLLKMGAGQYCDIYNIHAYQGRWGIAPLLAAVREAKPGMPIWQTEQMWHTIADRKKQSMLTAAMFFWFIDFGFEKYFSFGEDFFFSYYTLTPNPVLSTLAAMQNQLRKCSEFAGMIDDPKVKYFDLKHSFRRTDGTWFTALGQASSPRRWQLGGNVISLSDVYGRDVKFTREGDICRPDGAQEMLFAVSLQPVKVIAAEAVAAELCPNGGFEEISGDIAMGGLGNAVVSNWQFRDRTYDPQGRIGVVKGGHSGSYALALSSSGKGRVYAFFEQQINEPGSYEFSTWLKNPGTAPVEAYLAVFDRSGNVYKNCPLGQIKAGEFQRYRMTADFPRPPAGSVAFIIGLDKPGTIIADDVSLQPQSAVPVAGTRSLPVKNPEERRTFTRAGIAIGLDELVKKVPAEPVIKGIQFRRSDYPAMLSTADWRGISGSSLRLPVGGRTAGIAFLLTAMYVPSGTKILGELKLRYADGRETVMPLENGRHLRDWFLTAQPSGAVPAVRFLSERFNEYGVFLVELTNPHPESEIEAVEISAAGDGLLCIVAATALPQTAAGIAK